MNLHDRDGDRQQAIVKRERIVRQGARVDDDAGRSGRLLVEEVDDLALVVALKQAHLDIELSGLGAHGVVQVLQGPRAVDVRFALAEQVEVGAVGHDDALHASAFVMTRRTTALGTECPTSAWPRRLGITQATLPRRAFLSREIAAMTRFGSTWGTRSGSPYA